MVSDPNFLLVIIAILSTLLVLLFIKSYFFSSSKVIQKKLDTLSENLLILEARLQESEREKEVIKNSQKTTSFVSEKIQKIESLQDEIERQKEKVQETIVIAQDAMNVKYEFLANIRHEVRTPMNSILSFTDILNNELTNKTHLSYANNILISGRKMLTLLDDIIELSRLESGAFKIETTAVDVKIFFEDIVSNEMFIAYKKGLELSLEIDKNLPKSLMLDVKKVTEILSNIITNALKFTKKGSVKVTVVMEKENSVANSIDIAIMVEDSGCGIDKKEHQRIFEIFEKREEGSSAEFQSTGLGLSINRKMARAMNGDIYLASALGSGAIFTLKLQNVEVVLVNAKESGDDESLDFGLLKPEGAIVMVIDDKLNSMEVIRDSFMGSNTKVMAFDNPRDAISELKSKEFDIIFIDIDILTVDDNAVYKVLSGMSKASIISLTAKSIKNVKFLADSSHIVGHLKKPLSKVELFKISMKILNHEKSNLFHEKKEKVVKNEFKYLQKEKIDMFLKQDFTKLEGLYKTALSTNDLNSIKLFAQTLHKLADASHITPFMDYAEKLLEHIELFDIEVIHRMMNEYRGMMQRISSL